MNYKDFFNHPTLCTLPWSGVYLGPAGDVRNCSISSEVLGNINEEKITDILHSQKNINIKKSLLNKEKIKVCNACWTTENLDSMSSISSSNRSHFKTLTKVIPIELFKSPDNFNLKMVDLRWRNTCNLACVYCRDDLSSTWAKELGTKIEYNEDAINATKKQIFDNIKNLSYVYLCGGEPLLMKENYELVNLILEENPNIFLRINTNLTSLNSPIYDLILKCKNVHWIVSAESTHKNFEYVRYGANWDSWLQNLIQLKEDSIKNKHKITFNMVWCATTSFAIFDAIDHFSSLGFHDNAMLIQVLQYPKELVIQQINEQSYIKLKSIIKSRLLSVDKNSWLCTGYNAMLAELNKPSTHNSKLFQDFISALDYKRSLNGTELFADLF